MNSTLGKKLTYKGFNLQLKTNIRGSSDIYVTEISVVQIKQGQKFIKGGIFLNTYPLQPQLQSPPASRLPLHPRLSLSPVLEPDDSTRFLEVKFRITGQLERNAVSSF